MAQSASQALLGAAFLAYLQGTVLYELLLASRRPRLGRWATTSLLVGVAIQSLALLARWLAAGRLTLDSSVDTLAVYAWLTAGAYLALERVIREKALGALVAPLISLAVLSAILLPREAHPELAPFLRSAWLPAHVAVSAIGYASLSVAFGSAALYLLHESQLKGIRGHLLRLPPLGTLERVTYRLVEVGFVALTLTLISGAVGSEQAWGSYWSWEPKQTATLATWLVYVVYFHLRNVAGWSGRQTARCAVVGFVAVLVTYLVMNLFLPGQHDFGFGRVL